MDLHFKLKPKTSGSRISETLTIKANCGSLFLYRIEHKDAEVLITVPEEDGLMGLLDGTLVEGPLFDTLGKPDTWSWEIVPLHGGIEIVDLWNTSANINDLSLLLESKNGRTEEDLTELLHQYVTDPEMSKYRCQVEMLQQEWNAKIENHSVFITLGYTSERVIYD